MITLFMAENSRAKIYIYIYACAKNSRQECLCSGCIWSKIYDNLLHQQTTNRRNKQFCHKPCIYLEFLWMMPSIFFVFIFYFFIFALQSQENNHTQLRIKNRIEKNQIQINLFMTINMDVFFCWFCVISAIEIATFCSCCKWEISESYYRSDTWLDIPVFWNKWRIINAVKKIDGKSD